MKTKRAASFTGLPGLDKILNGIRLGDNVVLQVDTIDDYIQFVKPFCHEARQKKRTLIYFRFADHEVVIPECNCENIFELHPELGFENFISEIFEVIERFGKGAFYVFDCLSELSVDWYSDRMLGNFFMLACPYLYDYDTVAYFALIRNRHTSFAIDAIHNTAQVVIDVYRDADDIYVHPLKVDGRQSKTMYMLHRWEGEEFVPVLNSATTAEVLSSVPQPWLDFSMHRYDIWATSFLQAQEIVQTVGSCDGPTPKGGIFFDQMIRMAVSRDTRLLNLVKQYFDYSDIVDIGKRMIGTGLIGGKSVGMLLARAILRKNDPALAGRLEPHDSFYIGSDVFYSYLVQNKCWWIRKKLNDPESDLVLDEVSKERMLNGRFPQDIEDQFIKMLEYFGQSPIIVRSSSLLEDAYGNAFSGKYESVFCANQGTPQERLKNFLDAVRTVYTSTLSEEALAYRAHWGLLDRDEQMAILVQRVSGSVHEDRFFPQIAGVGVSFNPYVWNQEIDPKAGMLRLVFGLGTRAVDRVDDDYTRIVALNAPLRRPEASSEDVRKYCQKNGDIIDLAGNTLTTRGFQEIVEDLPDFPIEIFASRDMAVERWAQEAGRGEVFSWMLTFDELLSNSDFVKDMGRMLNVLDHAYDHPVDIEFTANFTDLARYKINLLQCRPFQAKGNILGVEEPFSVPSERTIMSSSGPVIGSNLATTIDRIIYVVPEAFGQMKLADRYEVARLIGKLNHLQSRKERRTTLLIGPGRWATADPFLGVPVSFSEINEVSVLCEVMSMHEGLVPEASLGTHFFNDLVEANMLYCAIYPTKEGNVLDKEFLAGAKNMLASLIPEAKPFSSSVKVIDGSNVKKGLQVCVKSDVMKQRLICYLDPVAEPSRK
ncbi:MAG: phosphoenolpyruvate synthase [Methanomassiliicoccales archaeon PtaU1.Bin124]|nr:MAG: phosphoenolpyruvate synthase [Methanomassiliicoccales archaeon PtaU1.Bin124]